MLNKAILFLLLLQLKLIAAYGQLPQRYQVAFSNSGLQKTSAALKINDIPSTITAAPNISYPSPQTYGINVPIAPLTPSNTGGAVPATIYGQNSIFAGAGNISYFQNITGLVVEADGTVYAANWGQNKINRVSAAGAISDFAGSYNSGSANGQGSAATFYEPDALVRDNAGNIYVSDQGNNLIRKITPAGLVSTFAGNGAFGAADNAIGPLASFNNPRGLTIDAAGNIYLADQGNNLIRKISPAGAVTTVAGGASAGFVNGSAASARFNTPTAVGIDNAGNLYVSDSQNGAIRKIATDGTVSTFATGLNFPRELRVDGTGNIYVTEQNNGSVSRISPGGVVNIVASGFSGPIALVLDGKGNLYLGETGVIRKVIISGYTIDKALPPGLSFNQQTGVISGTPASLWPATIYTITAYNGGGSFTTTVSLAVAATAKKPSIITLPVQQPNTLDANNNYNPNGTSTNPETPITYTSSNPAVATITANGLVHLVGPGVTTITANQSGNANYNDAVPVIQTLTVTENLFVDLPPFSVKTVCSADFDANAYIGDPIIPVTYASSNLNVATVSPLGIIHVTGAGTTIITISQNTSQQYYVSAVPKSQVLTVTLPVIPDVSITANYDNHCDGANITFTANAHNTGAAPKYQWQVNSINAGTSSAVFASSTLLNGDVVTCTVTNTASACLSGFPATSNNITVSLITPVTPAVTIAASAEYVFPGTPITFTATVNNYGNTAISYQWYVNDIAVGANSPTYSNNNWVNGDIIKCVIAAANICSTPTESHMLKVTVLSEVEIPNTFTPNSDGVNDIWFIKGLASYPDCLVNVYNRYGKLVYQSKGYSNPWNGRINGSDIPASTYYYVINLMVQNKVMSGHVTVIR